MRKRLGLAVVVLGVVGAVWWTSRGSSDWTPQPIAGLQMRCFEESAPVPWSFCLNQVPGSDNPDLVFHFHGRNGAASWWNDDPYYSGDMYRSWKASGVAAPTVASVSFGKLWLLTDRRDDLDGGLLRVFVETVVPRVERELGRPVRQRLLLGESMGGVNALLAGMKTHGMFARTAGLCPPLSPLSPFSAMGDIASYFHNSSTSWKRGLMLLAFSRKFYVDEADWARNDPVELARSYDPARDSKLHLTCGERDEWGCLDGSLALVSRVAERGGSVDWHRRPGGHCDVDAPAVAAFLKP